MLFRIFKHVGRYISLVSIVSSRESIAILGWSISLSARIFAVFVTTHGTSQGTDTLSYASSADSSSKLVSILPLLRSLRRTAELSKLSRPPGTYKAA